MAGWIEVPFFFSFNSLSNYFLQVGCRCSLPRNYNPFLTEHKESKEMLATSTCTPPRQGGQRAGRVVGCVCVPQMGTWKGEHRVSYWAGLAVLRVWQARDSMKI